VSANEYDGYDWASRVFERGAPLHELRAALRVAPDPLTEEELDGRRGAYSFIQEREKAGDE